MARRRLSRTDPEFWELNATAAYVHTREALDQYEEFCRWYGGDFSQQRNGNRGTRTRRGRRSGLDNFTNLATVASQAQLFFRNPQFVVRPAGSLNTALFTPRLAHVETELLNATIEEIGFFQQFKRCLTDALLGPVGILKVGYSFDGVFLDTDEIDKERKAADLENQAFVLAGKRPVVKASDLHSIHIEQHNQTIAAAERGEIPLPEKALAYLRKHVKMHEAQVPEERQIETLRNDSVWVRRKSPLNVCWDPMAEDPADRTWFRERYLARIDDVCDKYGEKWREKLSVVKSRWQAHGDLPIPPHNDIETPDAYCMLYENIDLVDGKSILTAQGAKDALEVRDYTLGSILPSGPYVTFSFMDDPFDGSGIAPPNIYRDHQLAATALANSNTTTAERSCAKLGYDAGSMSPDEIASMSKNVAASIIPFKNIGAGKKLSDMMQQVPPAEVPAQNVMMEGWHGQRIQQFTGLGEAAMTGGDTSRTATASAVVGQAVSGLSDARRASVDAALNLAGRYILRLERRFYTPDRVASIVGEDALGTDPNSPPTWPYEWAIRDIVNDRGVKVIPGSSARNDTAVEGKLLLDTYGAVAADPTIPVTFKMELLRRALEGRGVYGLDYDGVMEQVLEQKIVAMMQAQMGAGPTGAPGGASGSQPPGGGPPAPRPSEASDPSEAGQAQGIQNVGGSRIMTGASAGDNTRIMR